MNRAFCKLHGKQEGQALVEFALVLVILLILIMGIIDFGMAFHGLVTVNTAAREGARQGVVLENADGEVTTETVESAAHRVASTLPGSPESVTVSVNGGAGLPGSGDELIVRVSYDYSLLTPLPNFVNIRNPMTLVGEITMMRE